MDYITLSDIKNHHLKQFVQSAPSLIQEYVDEANEFYDETIDRVLYGQKYENWDETIIIDSEPKIPIPLLCKNMLLKYIEIRFATDSIGINNVEVEEDDFYVRMRERSEKDFESYYQQIDARVITGRLNFRSVKYTRVGKIKRG
ncbi:MAG: hypothetical protein K9L56_15005 [Clostridiales bacterium]|nr:hypothetical protein [Clostridiales bacterium]